MMIEDVEIFYFDLMMKQRLQKYSILIKWGYTCYRNIWIWTNDETEIAEIVVLPSNNETGIAEILSFHSMMK